MFFSPTFFIVFFSKKHFFSKKKLYFSKIIDFLKDFQCFFFSPRKIFCEKYFCWLLTKTNLTRCLLKGFDCFIKLRTSFEPNHQTPQRAVCGRYSMFNATPGTATVCAPCRGDFIQGRLQLFLASPPS